MARSYQSRVARAVVQYNTDGHGGSKFHESKNSSLSSIVSLKKLEETRKRKCEINAVAHAKKSKKPRYSDPVRDKGVHYGINSQQNDMSDHMFTVAKQRYLEQLEHDQAQRDYIMRSTIGQQKVRKWRDLQSKILSSWYFSRIVKARSPKSYTGILEDIIYKKVSFGNTGEIRHQKIYEGKALHCFTLVHGDQYLQECGLIIDETHCFLGASPLRLHGDNGIVVVKCPLAAFKKSIHEAVASKLINFWKIESGVEVVNKTSDWYIDIQGELHVAGKSYAFVVVWVEAEFKIEKVFRDDTFWAEMMEQKLINFYESAMIKELVDPRKRRQMKLRKYNCNTNSFE